jgi:hypothetical protein
MANHSLQQIRRAVGGEIGDMMLLEATADGDTTTLVDANNLWLPDRALINRVLYFTGGSEANIGSKRIATGNSQAATHVTWAVALLEPTLIGDVAEMWNTRGTGWDPIQDVNREINNVVRKALDYVWVPTMVEIGAFDQNVPYAAIPTEVRAFGAVEHDDDLGLRYTIPAARQQGQAGWWYEPGSGLLWINQPYAAAADTYNIYLHAEVDDVNMEIDSDTIGLPLEYILANVKANLLESSYDQNPTERGLFQRWQKNVNQAQSMRGVLGRRPMTDMVVVR